MKKEQIREGNKLIAIFMGNRVMCSPECFYQYYDSICTVESIKDWAKARLFYHISWDWLNSVIEKIDNLKYCDLNIAHTTLSKNLFHIEYNGGSTQMTPELSTYSAWRTRENDEAKIQNVWQAIVEFITWYNTTQTP